MSLLFEFGVREAGVINRLQFLNENGLSVGYVAESDGALAEMAFGYLAVDETVH